MVLCRVQGCSGAVLGGPPSLAEQCLAPQQICLPLSFPPAQLKAVPSAGMGVGSPYIRVFWWSKKQVSLAQPPRAKEMEVLRAAGNTAELEETPSGPVSQQLLSGRVALRCERGRLLSVPGARDPAAVAALLPAGPERDSCDPQRGGEALRASQQVCSGECWGQGGRSREEDSPSAPCPHSPVIGGSRAQGQG